MAEPAWLEVSLTVNGELAEAVSEIFARYAPQGVVIESTQIEDIPDHPGKPIGPLRICAYLPADDTLEETRQHLEDSLRRLSQIQKIPKPTFTPIEKTNWMEAWKEHFHPLPVGDRLLILPAWADNPAPERIAILIDPGMAFGTGAHPTTQLSLQMLETYTQPGKALLDIGTGSGILSIAARKLGADPVFGVDILEESILAAEGNAQLNHLADQIAFVRGSVSEIRSNLLPIQSAPVVIANILAHILIRLLDDGLGELVEPGGVLLLSGILDEKEAEILAALEKHGLAVEDRLQIDDWIGLVTTKD